MKIEIAALGTQSYVDIMSFVAFGGVEWSLNPVEAQKKGMDLSASMQRKKVADKEKLQISCIPLTSAEKRTLTNILKPQWLAVRVTTDENTADSYTETFTMYCDSTISAAYLIRKQDHELWEGFKFSLIEK